jgi:hypothetical protein
VLHVVNAPIFVHGLFYHGYVFVSRDALNGYSSTIDEDLALLREGNLSTRQRIAVEVRLVVIVACVYFV